jgi:hypothetical protein
VRERGREGGGRWRATWAESELGRDEKEGGSWAAAGLGWVVLFFFKSFFKPISNLFKFKYFTSFQIQILTQILQLF